MRYSIEELQALPDADLNALAAELRGLQYLPRFGNVFDFVWMNGDKVYAQEVAFADDRNQSGELLTWAVKHGATFLIPFDSIDNEIEVTIWETRSPINPRVILVIPGNGAHEETVAFCAAMLAMKGRLTQ